VPGGRRGGGAVVPGRAGGGVFKAGLILMAGVGVAGQIVWHLAHPSTPVYDTMGWAALGNLGANGLCLYLLTPYRRGDVNMASAWECSRNDVFEGLAVLAAAAGVWLFNAGWPDRVVAAGLLLMFLRSAWRVFRHAWTELKQGEN